MLTLDQILRGVNVWDEGHALAEDYKKFFTRLIENIAELEEAGHTKGYLNNDTLSTDGHIIKVVQEASAKTPTYRQELIEIAQEILHDTALSNHLKLERNDFLETLTDILNSTTREFRYFGVQELHSLNLTGSYGLNRDVDFAQLFGRKEDVENISNDTRRSFAKFYHEAKFDHEAKQEAYQPNAYGELLFARDALSHPPANMTREEVDDNLDHLFPKMMTDLSNFLEERGNLDYRTEYQNHLYGGMHEDPQQNIPNSKSEYGQQIYNSGNMSEYGQQMCSPAGYPERMYSPDSVLGYQQQHIPNNQFEYGQRIYNSDSMSEYGQHMYSPAGYPDQMYSPDIVFGYPQQYSPNNMSGGYPQQYGYQQQEIYPQHGYSEQPASYMLSQQDYDSDEKPNKCAIM